MPYIKKTKKLTADEVLYEMENSTVDFDRVLAKAFRHADEKQFRKLKNTFPAIWLKYAETESSKLIKQKMTSKLQ